MNQFQLQVNGKMLDTYEDVGISLNYQVEDILNITKKNTNFSKTITLPGTPFNNKFFKQYFEVNIDTITFNPKATMPAIIRCGEQELMVGNLQLLNVKRLDFSVDYEVAVFGQLKTLTDEWGDLTLANIDLSEYNHTRSKSVIADSWNYTITSFGNQTYVGPSGIGYVYPYIVNGQTNDYYDKLYCFNLYPAVYVKTIIDKAFELAGYEYSSNFFNSDYFKKLIIPFAKDNLQLTQNDYQNRITRVGVTGTGATFNSPFAMGPFQSLDTSTNTGFKATTTIRQNVSTSPSWYNNSLVSYYVPFERTSGSFVGVDFQNPNGEWFFTSGNSPSTSTARYTCANDGYYDINLTANVFIKYYHALGFPIEWNDNELKLYARIKHKRGNTTTNIAETSVPTSFYPSDAQSHSSPWLDLNAPIPIDMAQSNFYLLTGDILFIEFAFEFANVDFDGEDKNVFAACLLPDSYNQQTTKFEVIPSSNLVQGVNDPIDMNQILPDIAIKDFFTNILKMFNLVVWQDISNPLKVNIEPRDDFYNSRLRVLDWTYKLDQSDEIQITPMSELDAYKFYYTYKADKDYFNEEYTKETNRIYGDFELGVDNDFSNKVEKLELLFSPTPDSNFTIADRVAPQFVKMDGNTYKPLSVNLRILFYDGLKNTNYPYVLKDYVGQPQSSGFTLNQYAYCGMWDDPFSPSYDLGFAPTDKIYWTTTQYPVNTLFEQFHKNTLLDVIDRNSKLLEAKFVLKPIDIADLDFRDIILIDNSYWRINKIADYNPVGNDKTTKVELFKINNINISNPDNIKVGVQTAGLTNDLVIQDTPQGPAYISKSGDFITEDTCNALGGQYTNGVCWARTQLIPYLTDRDGNETRALVIKGATTATPFSISRTLDLGGGNNSIGSGNYIVRGDNNNVGLGVKSGLILGDYNSVPSQPPFDLSLTGITGSSNSYDKVIIVGDGITPNENTSIFVGKFKISGEDGIKLNEVYLIDGGLDEVMKINKTNLIDKMDGTFNNVRNYEGDSKARPIIDGGDLQSQDYPM